MRRALASPTCRANTHLRQAPNLQCFITRIAQHPERLQNVYFTYVVALRALSKAGPQILAALEDNSGDGGAANGTRAQLEDLINRAQSCPSTFDETSMFTGASSEVRLVLGRAMLPADVAPPRSSSPSSRSTFGTCRASWTASGATSAACGASCR